MMERQKNLMIARRLLRIASSLARTAAYSQDQTPSVYVGTYGKYNSGNIQGEWVDLDKFSSYEEFVRHCLSLHSDEKDPELMFQDYENFPAQYYGESSLKEELWDYIEKIKENDKDLVDAVLEDGHSLDDVDNVTVISDCISESEAAEKWIDETGGLKDWKRDDLERYFDYEAYARDLKVNGKSFISFRDGYIII